MLWINYFEGAIDNPPILSVSFRWHVQFSANGYDPLNQDKINGKCASLVAQMVKSLSAMWETQIRSLGQEDPLEKEMEVHSSTVAWKIPWTEEPGRLQSMGLQKVGHD